MATELVRLLSRDLWLILDIEGVGVGPHLLICPAVFVLAFVILLLPSLTSSLHSLLPTPSHILPVFGTNVRGSVLLLSAYEITAGDHMETNRPLLSRFCLVVYNLSMTKTLSGSLGPDMANLTYFSYKNFPESNPVFLRSTLLCAYIADALHLNEHRSRKQTHCRKIWQRIKLTYVVLKTGIRYESERQLRRILTNICKRNHFPCMAVAFETEVVINPEKPQPFPF